MLAKTRRKTSGYRTVGRTPNAIRCQITEQVAQQTQLGIVHNRAKPLRAAGGIEMECRLKCEKPGEIVYTMTITMNAESWEKLRDQLDASTLATSYPSWELRRQIDDLLGQARKIYWPTPEPVGANQ